MKQIGRNKPPKPPEKATGRAEIHLRCTLNRKRYVLELERRGQDAAIIGNRKIKSPLLPFLGRSAPEPKKIKFRSFVAVKGVSGACPYCGEKERFQCIYCGTYSCFNWDRDKVHVCPECQEVARGFKKREENTAISTGTKPPALPSAGKTALPKGGQNTKRIEKK